MHPALNELLEIRNDTNDANLSITGADPVFSTQFPVAGTCAAVLGAIGLSVADIWKMKTGRQQSVKVGTRAAGAALQSFEYLQFKQPDGSYAPATNSPLADAAYAITQPWPTQDGRWFLPHFGIAHLKRKVMDVLQCTDTPASVAAAVARWDALELEDTIAAAGACGGMVRTRDEWLAHPHGAALAARPVVEIEKIGDSDPIPFPKAGPALAGVRVLDLTRILAGPVAARTCAEHGADVLMVAARGVPQIKKFVIDLSHGKRSCYLDLNVADEAAQLRALASEADVFSQGYRPGVLEARGFGAEDLAALRPGIIHVSLSCFGQRGPLSDRAGWEQVAQCAVGISNSQGDGERPSLLPVPACDFLTGYLGAFGILVALTRRAREGGSYRVNVSLCQSGMFLQRQSPVTFNAPDLGGPLSEARDWQMESQSAYGALRHLAPITRFSESRPAWSRPTPALGGDSAVWLNRLS